MQLFSANAIFFLTPKTEILYPQKPPNAGLGKETGLIQARLVRTGYLDWAPPLVLELWDFSGLGFL